MKLDLEGVSVRYGARTAVEPTSLGIAGPDLLGLIGPNGAGKSSLLKALAGVVPCSGDMRLDGVPIQSLGASARARAMAYLPQARAAHWPITVGELVGLGRLPHRAFGRGPGRHDREAVERAMRQTDVAALADRRMDELSGGERARAQLARALAVGAPVLLADEPVSSLDPYHQLEIMGLLREQSRADTLVVAVLHDLTLAARFCSRLLLMHEGRLVADGGPERVLRRETLERYYRVEPHSSRRDGEALVVPWRTTRQT